MLSRLLHLGSRVCLILGIVASLLWCRSWVSASGFEHDRTELRGTLLCRTTTIVASHRGNLWLADRQTTEEQVTTGAEQPVSSSSGFCHGAVLDLPAQEPWTAVHRRGFVTQGFALRVTYVRLPWVVILWMLCIAPCAHLALALTRKCRRDGAIRNGCPTCGYDLRATPLRCPECGTLPQVVPSK